MHTLGTILLTFLGASSVSHAKALDDILVDAELVRIAEDQDIAYVLLIKSNLTNPDALSLKATIVYPGITFFGWEKDGEITRKLTPTEHYPVQECFNIDVRCYDLPAEVVDYHATSLQISGKVKRRLGIRKIERTSSTSTRDSSQRLGLNLFSGITLPRIPNIFDRIGPRSYSSLSLGKSEKSIYLSCDIGRYNLQPHCRSTLSTNLGKPEFRLVGKGDNSDLYYQSQYGYPIQNFVFVVQGECSGEQVYDKLGTKGDTRDAQRVSRRFPEKYKEGCNVRIHGEFGNGYVTDPLYFSSVSSVDSEREYIASTSL
jgi:hypothetical protein